MGDPVCYRHVDRVTHIQCQRCGRPVCPECMTEASVGFHCPECVREGRSRQRRPRTVAGGTLSAGVGVWSSVIIAVNVAVFLVVELTGGTSRSAIFLDGAMVADTVRSPQTGQILQGFTDGAWWRPVTSAFLHGSLAHLVLNMLAVFIFGRLVEHWLGSARFVATYVVSLFGASLAVLWWSDGNALTVGASGAVFGLFAMALVWQIRLRQDVRFLLALLIINIGFSLTSGISWQAHLGGFASGAILGVVFAFAPKSSRGLTHPAVVIVVGGAILLALYRPMLNG